MVSFSLGPWGDLQDDLLAFALGQDGAGHGSAPEVTGDDEAALEGVTGLGFGGDDVGRGIGGEEIRLDGVEVFDEVGDGVETAIDSGRGGGKHEVVQGAGHAILDSGEAEAAVIAQGLLEIEAGGGGRLAREHQPGESAQGEDIAVLACGLEGGESLGGEVDAGHAGCALDQVLHVDGAAGATLVAPGLPVHDLELGGHGVGGMHEDALGAEAAVEDLAAVGVAQGVSHLADEADAGDGIETGAHARDVVVEAHGPLFVVEDEGGAELVVAVGLGAENPGVVKRLDELELAASGADDLFALLLRGSACEDVLPNPALDGVQGDVAGQPVLVAGALVQEMVELVVADLAGAVRGADACLFHGRDDDALLLQGERTRGRRTGSQRWRRERGDDAGDGLGSHGADAPGPSEDGPAGHVAGVDVVPGPFGEADLGGRDGTGRREPPRRGSGRRGPCGPHPAGRGWT